MVKLPLSALRGVSLSPRPWLLAAFCLLFLAACYPGSYPLDFFIEMHYQPSQRYLEPNRLAPPPDSVPVTGGTPAYTYEQASTLTNPAARTPQSQARGREVFRVNCGMCHGPDGRGQSFVAERWARAGFLPPPDLNSPRVRARNEGQLYWIVTNGLGNMPPFGDLLTEDERWLVVHLIRDVQGR